VTTYFPEDHCKVHILVWNLTEEQHREIQKIRRNIYEFSDYLRNENLVHGVACPLTPVNGLLSVDHVEKLLLLFRIFDGSNISTSGLQQAVFRSLIEQLDKPCIEELANRHGITPRDEKPWEKVLFGGSMTMPGCISERHGLRWMRQAPRTHSSGHLSGVKAGRRVRPVT
jgi:hypothetical protein